MTLIYVKTEWEPEMITITITIIKGQRVPIWGLFWQSLQRVSFYSHLHQSLLEYRICICCCNSFAFLGFKKLCHNFYKQPFVKHGKRTFILCCFCYSLLFLFTELSVCVSHYIIRLFLQLYFYFLYKPERNFLFY